MENVKRKELINNYKQQEVEMGIIQVYNTINGFSFVDICQNLYKPFESIKFKLNLGKIRIKNFQEDWDKYGENVFEFIIVEKLKKKENSTDKETLDDLKELLNLWIDNQGDNLKLYNK
ncbi:LuxR family transcriptional regulator [Clostridium sartagoforme AAU1]|uniref:LuxR family transcriptional regulator n=3 Tax=Clostridium sartagoforme TaxID=84031 RepID=R9CCW4_9CLOT|nr:GIY-YIG nuclease family protein [Clostridium sartagoforme]EOR25061.1 LuxR family transcriptional regulator [Clostridium sartagoforme AAU1]KLE15409.1 LuxR family transcriptional regulator [Clostridium sp. C8]